MKTKTMLPWLLSVGLLASLGANLTDTILSVHRHRALQIVTTVVDLGLAPFVGVAWRERFKRPRPSSEPSDEAAPSAV